MDKQAVRGCPSWGCRLLKFVHNQVRTSVIDPIGQPVDTDRNITKNVRRDLCEKSAQHNLINTELVNENERR